MGHLGRLKDQYRDLTDRLDRGTVGLPAAQDAAAEAGRRELLEILFTPDEAALAARLPLRPMSAEKLAPRLGMSAEELERRLEPMCERGVVMDLVNPRSGKRVYLLSPPVVGFFEYSLMRAQDSIPKKRLADALHAYLAGDPAFAKDVFGHGTVIGRALVHEPEVADDLPEVLAWERATEVIGSARQWAVSLCYCRHGAEHRGARCDAPMDNCLSINGGAEFVVRRGFGRAVERTEALELLARSREAGLVQIADNVKKRPTFVCNCCGCCCEQLQAINTWGLPAVNPSGFFPRRDEATCSGCSRCARACPVGAVTMHPVPAPGHRRSSLAPRFDEERCIGCGVCAGACAKGSLSLTRGGRPRPVPDTILEKVVRQAVERNRLADLLFDEGAGTGARFLRNAVDAVLRLPPAQALLASEQVRSTFVKAAMSRLR
jgi:Fe-S-cluster-containing hydrogenase component 2